MASYGAQSHGDAVLDMGDISQEQLYVPGNVDGADTANNTNSAPDPFSFMEFQQPTDNAAYDLSGTIEHESVSGHVGGTTQAHYRHLTYNGPAGQFLETQGFGWLLDVEDDEEFQKPLLEELDIDVTDIYYKIRCVLLPLPYFRMKLALLRDNPDFWGPLMVVLLFSLLSMYGQLTVISWILTIWLLGSFCIFFLARVLGGDVGYTQCLGIIGYCLIPLVVTGLMAPVFSSLPYVATVIRTFGLCWAVYSSGHLLCVEELAHKRPLLLYPICLLYIYFLSIHTGV